MDKTELIEMLEDGRQEMLEMIEDLPDEVLLEPGVAGEWSIKDILAHLTFWEGQIVTLLFQAKGGMVKPTTAHFGKETVDDVNKRWYEAGKQRSLDIVWQDWTGVRNQTIRRVAEFSDKDLNDPQRFPWLGEIPLNQWIANDSYEHEDEHADQIRDWLDQRDETLSQNNGSSKK
ncbi:MAG: ClbS/DfsB family four-helix bundle protein [Chloroflexi bacterium]|nr:MAG: ClbS/DfsB family four-helix bundle protein [Chloroflexota bacterium]